MNEELTINKGKSFNRIMSGGMNNERIRIKIWL